MWERLTRGGEKDLKGLSDEREMSDWKRDKKKRN